MTTRLQTSLRSSSVPAWMKLTLIAAGVYNLIWGALTIAYPAALFHWAGMEIPRYPAIWQCVGMIVGVYGIGYLAAAADPLRHWPIVLVGLLGKLFGPIGFLTAALSGDLPWSFGATIVTNDLIWWGPFAMILFQAFRHHSDPAVRDAAAKSSADELVSLPDLLQQRESHRGFTLSELSRGRPLLLVFLRHAGCTFCREAVADLAAARKQIESLGGILAIVHMSSPMTATQLLAQHGLDDLHRFSDPGCELYKAFGLDRGGFCQLFGPKVWWRGLYAGLVEGHGIGPLDGDGFRMPGVFVLKHDRILAAYRASSAADRPDYVELLRQARSLNDQLFSPGREVPARDVAGHPSASPVAHIDTASLSHDRAPN